MLRVAVPNKGALAEAAMHMLSEAGYLQRRDRKELRLQDEANGVEFFYLRPKDVAIFVGRGIIDIGITGRDLFADADVGHGAEEVLGLNFGKATFRLAAPNGRFSSAADLSGGRIATTYDGLLSDWLEEHGLDDVEVVHLDGAVESAVTLGVADAVADVVETGSTLKAAGMETFGEPILNSEAIVISAAGERSSVGDQNGADRLIRRLQGVLVARQYVMMDYDIRRDLLERASAITPGLESPTISPLADENWVAVRSMVPAQQTNQLMDELYELGARAILVTTIHACRI